LNREPLPPLHIAHVGKGTLPFFKGPSPNPEVPYHAHGHLVACLGVSDAIQEKFRHALANGPFKDDVRVIATTDGILTVAPHAAALGLIAGAIEARVVDQEFQHSYIAAVSQALEILAGDLPPMAAFDFAMAAIRNSAEVGS
jgi:hypothetical protein